MKAVRLDGNVISEVSEELKTDRNLVLAAVMCTGGALGWTNFLGDKEVVLAAVRCDGEALDLAEAALQADREVVEAAVLQEGSSMQYASSDLQNDKEFAFGLAMQSKWAIEYAGPAVTGDKSCMAAVIGLGEQCDPDYKKGEPHWTPLKYASVKLQEDKDLVLQAVWQNGYNLDYASDELKADRDVAVRAMTSPVGWRIWDLLPEALHKDKAFALEIVRHEERIRDEFLAFFSEDELTQAT